MVSGPTFRKEQLRRARRAQLGISESFFRESVKKDPEAPVIVERGVIACNTPGYRSGGTVRSITKLTSRHNGLRFSKALSLMSKPADSQSVAICRFPALHSALSTMKKSLMSCCNENLIAAPVHLG
jgi:hypothetical protein